MLYLQTKCGWVWSLKVLMMLVLTLPIRIGMQHKQSDNIFFYSRFTASYMNSLGNSLGKYDML